MNAQADEPPSGIPPHDPDRDVLAERRARRGDLGGDPLLIRRAETAEAAAQALEDRLAGIQTRLQEAERESQSASQRLAEREQELTRASQRLTDGEHQLRSISERLAERERELHSVSQRLEDRERELHSVSQRLGEREGELREVSQRLTEREQQLQRAEEEIRGRVEALEQRVSEVQRELAGERAAREAAERDLAALRYTQAAVQPLVAELRQVAQRLRLAAEAGVAATPAQTLAQPPTAPLESQPSATSPASQPTATSPASRPSAAPPERPSAASPKPPPAAASPVPQQPGALPRPSVAAPAPTSPEAARHQPSGAQMAEALAAAVQRLRARVAAVGEPREEQLSGGDVEPRAEEPAEARVPYIPPPAIEREPARAWLAPAIRRVAERRDARLAAELVVELLPAQVLAVEGAVRYVAKIAELGNYEVTLSADGGAVHELTAAPTKPPEFVLEGPAAAFAEVAAGGSRLSAWRPPAGLRVKHGRRRARRLLRSRGAPLCLSDLEQAHVTVWPGLLLLALAEAIDPASTVGQAFTLVFAIEGRQSAVLQVRAQSGKPLAVMRGGLEPASTGAQANLAVRSETTVRLSERGFARMLAGEDLAGEKVWLEGERAPLETLLSWTDRVQGIRRQPA